MLSSYTAWGRRGIAGEGDHPAQSQSSSLVSLRERDHRRLPPLSDKHGPSRSQFLGRQIASETKHPTDCRVCPYRGMPRKPGERKKERASERAPAGSRQDLKTLDGGFPGMWPPWVPTTELDRPIHEQAKHPPHAGSALSALKPLHTQAGYTVTKHLWLSPRPWQASRLYDTVNNPPICQESGQWFRVAGYTTRSLLPRRKGTKVAT